MESRPSRQLSEKYLQGATTVSALSVQDAIDSPATPRERLAEVSEPSEESLDLWRRANAVCFDIDCTVCVNDSLDLLAEFMGVGEQVANLTNKAMDGAMSLEDALHERLHIIDCTPDDIKRFIQKYPPTARIAPGAKDLIRQLQARGTEVYLISGGFRELALPIARELGVPINNLYANRMNWQVDDETGMPTKLVGFDEREMTGHGMGKPRVIERLRQLHPYETVVMVGDGITDLEAVQVSGGADLFIGYGGVVVRNVVAKEADWYVLDFSVLSAALPKYKVAIIGSGAWACAAAKMVAYNAAKDDPAEEFVNIVNMWVFEEEWKGGKLTDAINELHENPKYMPGVNIGANVRAIPDLEAAVKDANVLVFVTPHQFMHRICNQLRGKVRRDAVAISLTKGMRVRPDGPQLISHMIHSMLHIECGVLMGANIAEQIADMHLSEATIAFNNTADGTVFAKLFETSYFYVTLTSDVAGTEMCGTLKNVVALGVGMVQGLGYGNNTEAAIIRGGLMEMRIFSKRLYPNVRDDTFFESCGVADLVASSMGGRNRKVAAAFTKAYLEGKPKTFEELEGELLAGQKLQGALTSEEVQAIIARNGWEADLPLFTTINRIVNGQLPPTDIVRYRQAWNQSKAPVPSPSCDSLGVSALVLGDVLKPGLAGATNGTAAVSFAPIAAHSFKGKLVGV